MEAVIEMYLITVRLGVIHLFVGGILAWLLSKKFKKYNTKKTALFILAGTSILSYLLLCYQYAVSFCSGRSDSSYCVNEVLIVAGKLGVAFIPAIFLVGILGFFITRRFLPHTKSTPK